MVSIFTVPWESVCIEHVRGFLAEAGEEGLNWEAAGEGAPDQSDERLRPEKLRREAMPHAYTGTREAVQDVVGASVRRLIPYRDEHDARQAKRGARRCRNLRAGGRLRQSPGSRC